MDKLCKDCKWFERYVPISIKLRHCLSPKRSFTNQTNGKNFANIERMNGSNCGPNANNYEKR